MADGAETIEGACLCGAVRVRTSPPEPHVEACHCSMCRRWGGGPFLSLKSVTDPDISGEENIVLYHSSDWADRGFCGKCGTHLFYFFRPTQGYSFAAGLFEELPGYVMAKEIFIDEAAAYYDGAMAKGSETLTGAEVIAKYKPEGQ